ncbi:phospholipid scramblase 1-like isoform X2 [Sitodiplosis mosellana]|uniref:phospholipid scramblase 1-like isoform X2 n=1 Tax=Sitodiplosis mosellana TaxID=263140 RepID=UPI0024452AC3|nr:phospholipid scramblase 1-like isoform X2 [Sitodiplosis mosellana]
MANNYNVNFSTNTGYPPSGQFQPIAAQPMPMPIAAQPQPGPNSGTWMIAPTVTPNCPPGLEYLASVDQLLVHQKVELLEVITGIETNNQYEIKNTLGQRVYFAAEDNDCCTLNCCGPSRPFDMKIFDVNQREVMRFDRPLACSSCCFPCCLQSLVVSAPVGNVIGPCCTFSCGGDVEFKILSLNGNQVGKISKQWSGLAKEMFTDADNFGISFPMDLDVCMKAVMLGACILIDMMFFETTDDN